ncbi:hypothetical protein ACLM5H_13100 [Fredinandcohnia humi]
MKRQLVLLIFILFSSSLFLAGCNKEASNGPTALDENLNMVKQLITGMLENDVEVVNALYKNEANYSSEELIEKVSNWGLENKTIDDLTFKTASAYVYHVYIDKSSYISVRVKENPPSGYTIDFVELITKEKQ